jgi:uncharacterized repeat protein (TIGR03803 family)
MKMHSKHPFLLFVLLTGLSMLLAGPATAQTFKTLHSFTALDPGTSVNSDGVNPYGGLIVSGNTLYGTAGSGGSGGSGTVFSMNADGTGFTNLHIFSPVDDPNGFLPVNSDGVRPWGSMVLSGNTLYGATMLGGSSGRGTLFAIQTDGTGFTTLHTFTADDPFSIVSTDGLQPQGSLALSGNTLYGATEYGGSAGGGTLFAIETDGTGFRTLHSFAWDGPYGNPQASGIRPQAGVVLSGNTLYGTAMSGGGWDAGTLFAIQTDGTGFTTLHSFTGNDSSNSDGVGPSGRLVLSGNTLYGTAGSGGSGGGGTLFAFNTDGTGFTTLHSFTAALGTGIVTNSDGSIPGNSVSLSGNTLYGTTGLGGSNGTGNVFAVNKDGTGFTTLHSFAPGDWGRWAELLQSGNFLYGTKYGGGNSGNGTVFSLSLGPVTPTQLTLAPSGSNVILSWPTDATGFTLQSTTNLVSPVWDAVSTAPVVVNGLNTVTNPISGTQQFFRLSK